MSLRALSSAAAVTLTGGFALAFYYAPEDADQGIIQKIFYLHVPMAIVALCGFVAGGVFAIQQYGGTPGLIEGNPMQVVNQVIGVVTVFVYDAVVTLIILKIIDDVMKGPRPQTEHSAGHVA